MPREQVTWDSLSCYERFKDVLTFISGLSVMLLIFINIYSIKNIVDPPKIYNNYVVIRYMDEYSHMSSDIEAYKRAYKARQPFCGADTVMKNYFALSEQELFYIKNDVISPEIADEWLSSMLRQMQKFKHDPQYEQISQGYRRVKTTFRHDLDTLQEASASDTTPKPISKAQLDICKCNLASYNSNKKDKQYSF